MKVDQAMRAVVLRGKLLQSLPAADGVMVSLVTTKETVEQALERLQPDIKQLVSIAAVNSSQQVVVAGQRAAVDALQKQLGLQGRQLQVSHAFHSPLMADAVEPFRRVMQDVTLAAPSDLPVTVLSSVTGHNQSLAQSQNHSDGTAPLMITRPTTGPTAGAAGVVRCVCGRAAEPRLHEFVEIGPQPVLTKLAKRSFDAAAKSSSGGSGAAGAGAQWVASIDPSNPASLQQLPSLRPPQ